MAQLNNQGIRTAKKNVAHWFVGTDARRFLPTTGPAIAVSAEEELAIKAGCEPYIAKSYDRLTTRVLALMLSVVAVVTLFTW